MGYNFILILFLNISFIVLFRKYLFWCKFYEFYSFIFSINISIIAKFIFFNLLWELGVADLERRQWLDQEHAMARRIVKILKTLIKTLNY